MQPQKKHPISVAVWKTLLQSIDVLLSHLLLHCLNFVSSMPDRLSTKLYESKITLWMNVSIYQQSLKHGLSLMNPLIFLCVIYAQKDTLSFTAPIPLVLVVSVSITTYYMLSIAIVVWFCYYSIYRPCLTLLTTTYYSTDSNLSLQLMVKHCSCSNPIFLNILSLLVSTWINPYLMN